MAIIFETFLGDEWTVLGDGADEVESEVTERVCDNIAG